MEPSYLDQSPASVQLVEIAVARTVIGVPLISANKVIGIVVSNDTMLKPSPIIKSSSLPTLRSRPSSRAATESLAQNKKLTLATFVDKSLPVGLGDEERLIQVLLNLVGNAIKFTDAGEVRVSATTVNSHFAVSVADTGPGIPEEHQARIFEQFH